ncbi:MAG: hypothetical protein M3R01_00785, partial [Actinomycetota bacterium]|nr:hypothetical protein [Actinomycetota bacterium]
MRHPRVLVATVLTLLSASGLAACEQPPPPAIFPSDSQTVADSSQQTGRRVNLPLPDCTARPSDCNDVRLINELDGFDLAPRVSVDFTGPLIDIGKVNTNTVYLQRVGDSRHIGLQPLVLDRSTNTLFGQPEEILRERSRYEIVVTSAVNGQAGTSAFGTMSASVGLRRMVGQLDSDAAYTAAGITAGQRGLDFVIDGQRRVYPAANVVRPRRFDDLRVGSGDALVEQPVFDSGDANLGAAGTYAFGSFLAPQWIDGDRKIPNVATGAAAGPTVRGRARVGFTMILPQATPTRPKPAGGWPVAIFGPGVTRSKYDLFLASDENLKKGIATVAIDPVGHAYGPASRSGVDLLIPLSEVKFTGFGRAVDVEGDGEYSARDGLSTARQPARDASIA